MDDIMTDDQIAREYLRWRYNKPQRLDDRGDVLVFLHESQEAAEAYAAANREFYDHPSAVELSDEGWLSLVDIGPAIARIKQEFTDGASPVGYDPNGVTDETRW